MCGRLTSESWNGERGFRRWSCPELPEPAILPWQAMPGDSDSPGASFHTLASWLASTFADS